MNDEHETVEDLNLADLADRLDSEGMVGFARQTVDDFRQGFEAVNPERFPWLNDLKSAPWTGVMCLGMGGSAAGGDFLAALTAHHGRCPVVVHREYTLPAWFDASWLVMATSHSGNTEETVAATQAALKQGATVIVIATGGELAGLPELHPTCHLVPSIGGQPPRTAFGHLLSRQLACLEALDLMPSMPEHARAAMFDRLQANNEHFDAIAQPEGDIALLAASMIDRPIALIGPTELSPALNRFKNQMNENAARFVRVGVIPEMNHNESVAWGGVGQDSDPASADQALLVLTWGGMHPRVQQRLDWMVAHASTETAWNLVGEGESLLESLLYHCLVMDWLSVSLAFLHGKAPAAIAPISSLKQHLSSVR